jgi:hypothetical protein
MYLNEDLQTAVEADINKAFADRDENRPDQRIKCDDLYHALGHVSLDDFRAIFSKVSDARVKAAAEKAKVTSVETKTTVGPAKNKVAVNGSLP